MKADIINVIKSNLSKITGNKKLLYKILLIIIILILALMLRAKNSSAKEVKVDVSDSNLTSREMYVDIGGAVKSPGVYKVKEDTRLYEVIDMAGGLNEQADLNTINQAAFVEDGQKIIVPVVGENQTSNEDVSEQNKISKNKSGTSESKGKININSASKEELKTLSGIGDVIAERIIEHRSNSSFKSKEDIMSVKGIGNAIYEKLENQITV